MKNRWRTISTLSLGVALAFGMMSSTVKASFADTSTEVKKDSNLLDINLPNLPIVGDVKVTIPSKQTDDNDQSLLSVEVSDGILDEVTVSVGAESETENGMKKSLATVEVNSAITKDVNVDIASGDEQEGSFIGGLVEANAEDIPLLGEMHVGVLDKHTIEDGAHKSVSSSLVQVDVDSDLLEDTSVQVLAAEKNNDAAGNESMAAVADVSIGGGALEGLVEDVEVSVLKDRKFERDDIEQSTSSIGSVGLESSLTNEVNVDVGLQNLKVEGEAASFDGGLVEANAEDLPLLGEMHVGVLDKHVNSDEDGRTFSTGLAQVSLDGDLLEDTTVDVVYQNGATTEDGLLVMSGVASTDLGLLGLEPVAVDLLKREELFPVNTENSPSTGGGDDDGDDNENTVPPTVIDPVPGDGNDDGNGNTIPPTVIDPAPGNGGGNENEDGKPVPPTILVPAPGDEDDSSNGNGNGNEGADGNDNGSIDSDGNENGTALVPEDGSGIPPATENGEVDADSGDREKGMDSNLVPGEDSSPVASEGTGHSAHAPKDVMTLGSMNSQSMRGSLPQTGGTFDGKRLLIIAVVFLIVGAGLRRFGKSEQSAA